MEVLRAILWRVRNPVLALRVSWMLRVWSPDRRSAWIREREREAAQRLLA
jgi:hypothetical protein